MPSRCRAAPPARGETVLSVRKARKQFGGLVAVNDVSFDVRAGEIVGLIGPNGAGKSTLFNLITGVLPLTAGQVDYRGARVSGLSSRAIAQRGMSRTFQHVRMIADMSVLENVALGAHRRGRAGVLRAMLRLDRRDERRLLAEAWKQLQRIGMTALADEPAGNLALGQQRLMEIARALCTDPALLLLDEPAAGLRLKEKQALGEVLSQAARRGHEPAAGGARHGLRDDAHRPHRGGGVRHQADRGQPGSRARGSRGARRLPRAWSTDGRAPAPEGGRPACRLRPRRGAVRREHRGRGRQRGGRRRAQRRRQEHAAQRVDGRAPVARRDRASTAKPVSRLSLEQRVQRGIALVPETRALFATMPVADNLLLGGYRQRRAPRAEQAARLDAVYALFPRLHERRAQAAGTLSGGERQMLAIGRALMGSPRLLMLDEPSLGLAPLVVKEIFRIIERLRETGTTILLIEQNARAAMAVADHAYVLETGAIALSGPAAELAADPRVIETYLGKAKA